ncbi:hypothetical protein KW076_01830 [Micrococcus porci]|uniref:hypothetical protein n=1 Tax=Micrococcus TaxID=1269 RepID=UPI001CCB5307|nr:MULTISPECIES: hypothetical protein [Micrococcus]MCG7422071.1 hypothetical protein [Micrococcus sp. ACRRV]UBH24965.1 hypothetical protein KW076_01830 [Micrococcus porci]
MRLARIATLVAGAAAAYGVRSWRQQREDKAVWASATDSLEPRKAPAEDGRGEDEETPQG